MDIYNFNIKDINGNDISMNEYKDYVILIVNTASKCGFTPQFAGLQELYEKYKNRKFVILGFPCNQFGNQEPDTNENIGKFCQINYGVSFPMMSKIDVNGKNSEPLYEFLKKSKGGVFSDAIKWNFTKFLIDRQGNVTERFAPTTKPEELREKIENLL